LGILETKQKFASARECVVLRSYSASKILKQRQDEQRDPLFSTLALTLQCVVADLTDRWTAMTWQHLRGGLWAMAAKNS
jgi:hypothetical protein